MGVIFSFRKADLKDCPLIRELASQVWGHTYGDILTQEQLDYMFEMMYSVEHIKQQMTELHHQYFIVSADGEPSGYLSIETKPGDVFNFQKIYSIPSMHGKGMGRFIIEEGVKYLKSVHPTPFTIELYVNRSNPAVGFYEHMGLRKVATRDHPIGNGFYMNDYIMSMEVDN